MTKKDKQKYKFRFLKGQFLHYLWLTILGFSVVGCICFDCGQSQAQTVVNEEQLKTKKLEAEIEKLQAEVESLQQTNTNFPIKIITAILGAGGGLVASGVTIFIFLLGKQFSKEISLAEKQKLEQEKEFGREKQNLELFKVLADEKNSQVQLAAASILVQRLNEFNRKEEDLTGQHERNTIISVLLSATKKSKNNELSKLIGDNLIESMNARVPETKYPSTHQSPLAGLYWQNSKFMGVWWKRIDARYIDFFGAKIENSGLAEAFLDEAVFYEGSLQGTVLREANLQRANLQRVNLKKANLQKANLKKAELQGADLFEADLFEADLKGAIYNTQTRWPDDFDPNQAGAIKENA